VIFGMASIFKERKYYTFGAVEFPYSTQTIYP
jgi:hypothetical protein